jgi:hypothetical protein
MMRISMINLTMTVPDEELQEVIRVINRQIREDFEPYWGMSALVRLEGKSSLRPRMQNPVDMRGDAILYLADEVQAAGYLGYHEANFRGIPYGFVFTELARQVGESWTVTLSHEALELIADPEANILVAGPHPDHPNREVFHWYEMCDAVQDQSYEIDGVEVSNFLLPLYFTKHAEPGSRNEFLGNLPALESFGVSPGGYIGFFDPSTGESDTYEADMRARMRARIKEQAGQMRRSVRYSQLGTAAGALERWRRGATRGRTGILARRFGPARARVRAGSRLRGRF